MGGPKEKTRREFLTDAGTAAAAFMIVPRHVLGRGFAAPSDTLNIASVGIGGMGRANLINLSDQNVVALCDVDWDYAGKALDRLDADVERLQTRISRAGVEPSGQGQAAAPAGAAAPPPFNVEKGKTQ